MIYLIIAISAIVFTIWTLFWGSIQIRCNDRDFNIEAKGWNDYTGSIRKLIAFLMKEMYCRTIMITELRGQLNKLIEEYNLPPVVFHSLRHSSVTYKLKLNGGDIKAVQGDSGHSQVDMVTDVYSHIIDEDRRRNAELFEEAFYEKKNLDPKMRDETATQTVDVPEDVDAELLAKVLANPEMKALMASLAKAMK